MQVAMEREQFERRTVFSILFSISLVHMLNDTSQSVIPAIFPILKESMHLSYMQLGMVTFALNITSSLLQPVVGLYADNRPSPYLPSLGMVSTLLGMLGLAFAPNFWFVLPSVILIGFGSAAFHPEGSRIANLAAGNRRGLAQSIYQVGGNFGQSLAPVLTALVFVPLGQFGAIWFTTVAALAAIVLLYVASWYREQLRQVRLIVRKPFSGAEETEEKEGKKEHRRQKKTAGFALGLLVLLVFIRSWYSTAISNFYAFYLIEEFKIRIDAAQVYIFLFLFAGVAGTFFGGPLADRFGKRNLLLFSMVGSFPFALLLPYVNAFWAYPVLALLGFILLSSFSVSVVYAQDLFPGKVGTISGLIVGLAFGMGAIGAVALGSLADLIGVKNMIFLAGFLPVLGLFTFFLPSDEKLAKESSF
ncbi:MFS transporter [Thermicanus aegyptius]|uniref:MFS transporter n=1 Tax=Thermicanus aegyptius TaxID=94009 RepID=UPI0004139738|nr:MFS transporter [Thermicanus aegyptius]